MRPPGLTMRGARFQQRIQFFLFPVDHHPQCHERCESRDEWVPSEVRPVPLHPPGAVCSEWAALERVLWLSSALSFLRRAGRASRRLPFSALWFSRSAAVSATGLIHAHIERPIRLKRKSPFRIGQLKSAHSEIRDQAVQPGQTATPKTPRAETRSAPQTPRSSASPSRATADPDRSRSAVRPAVNRAAIAAVCPPRPAVQSRYVPSGLIARYSSDSASMTG